MTIRQLPQFRDKSSKEKKKIFFFLFFFFFFSLCNIAEEGREKVG